jgi:hypothetical protein
MQENYKTSTFGARFIGIMHAPALPCVRATAVATHLNQIDPANSTTPPSRPPCRMYDTHKTSVRFMSIVHAMAL